MLLHAEIRTDRDTPVAVTVAGRSADCPALPDAPARAVRLALDSLGYAPVGLFHKVSDAVTTVDVQVTPAGFLAHLAERAQRQPAS